MAVQAQTPEELAQARKDAELKAAQVKADATNETRTGIGTRVMVGRTRGKGSLVISYEQFDESKPETVPTSVQSFIDTTGTKDDAALTKYLISGYNAELYTAASDPLAEFVNDAWKEDVKTQFRLVVRNYSRGANVSLDDAVKLIKPGFDAQYSK